MVWTSRDRIPVGARFSTHVQTGPGAHPDSYTVGTGSFLGVKQLGHDHPPLSSAKVEVRVELYIGSSCGPLWPVLEWTLPLIFINNVNCSKSVQVTVRSQCFWTAFCETTAWRVNRFPSQTVQVICERVIEEHIAHILCRPSNWK
jgi:hypothetical protein